MNGIIHLATSAHDSTKAVAFKDVTVIPMDSERLLNSYTVVVKDGRIASMGPSDTTEIPAGADVVEGQGMFLLPGLANMHAHLIEFDPEPEHLALYLAGGVCTVRSLNSQPDIFDWRKKIARGDWIGPTILMSGPVIVGFPPDYRLLAIGLRTVAVLGLTFGSALILGIASLLLLAFGGTSTAIQFARQAAVPWMLTSFVAAIVTVWRKLIPLRALAARVLPMAAVVETPKQAAAEVKRQARAGVDFVKPYDHLDRETYFAALHAAQQEGIYSAGHIPDQPEIVTVREALEAGLNEVVHADELSHEFLVDYDPEAWGLVEWEVATDRIEEIANLIAEHEAAVTATLITNEAVLLGLENLESLLQRPEYKLIKSETIAKWKSSGRMVRWKGQENYRRLHLRPLWMKLTIALHRAGVPILLGTDSDVEGIVPGFSEHRELELLVETGMTPFEALSTATRNGARIAKRMGVDSDCGTIEVGKRADLVLLSDNPLEDIRNTKQISGVVVRGHWLTRGDLDGLVAQYRENQR
jgi:imidazolonepropionase-like amidohydrolase